MACQGIRFFSFILAFFMDDWEERSVVSELVGLDEKIVFC